MGGKRGTPWTGRQCIAGQHLEIQDKQPCTHPFTPKGNLERIINLTGMSLDCGRKLEYPVRTHACTWRTCKLHAESPPAGSRTWDLLAVRQQCYQLSTGSSDVCLRATRCAVVPLSAIVALHTPPPSKSISLHPVQPLM
ncbi:hypothetical protein CHARACLAT_027328 [Characodon lateralis]|uniref:Uncharacterized protein n=1 Tax=Characodon lateralis TaxID=208331 RepID=A0ABU7DB74_9TELE|nr:hypothetical protein [Characodon lateralis]